MLGYLIRISVTPQTAKLDNGKHKKLFDSPLQVNKIKYGTSGLKKTTQWFHFASCHT